MADQKQRPLINEIAVTLIAIIKVAHEVVSVSAIRLLHFCVLFVACYHDSLSLDW